MTTERHVNRTRRISGGQLNSRSGNSSKNTMDLTCEELTARNILDEGPPYMRKWARWTKCKTNRFYDDETYLNIEPPVSKCSEPRTLSYIDDVLAANLCPQMNDVAKDEVMDTWREIKDHEILAYYGVSNSCNPTASRFNSEIAKSMRVANAVPKTPKPYVKPDRTWRKKVPEPNGTYVLDLECLRKKLDKMPNVKRQLKATNTLKYLYCPPPDNPEFPFEDNYGSPTIPLKRVLDMEKPPKQPKHGLRRKHWYCPMDCGEPQNTCTKYEWAKYKESPRSYEEAYKREMAAIQAEKLREPRNYEELYKALAPCFVQSPEQNEMCAMLAKCCKRPGDPPTPGCGEFVPEGAGGDGKDTGDDKDKDDGKGRDKKKDGGDEDDLRVGDGDGDDDGGTGKGKGKGKGKGDDGDGGDDKKGAGDGDGDGDGGDKGDKGKGKGDKGKGGGDKGKGKGKGKRKEEEVEEEVEPEPEPAQVKKPIPKQEPPRRVKKEPPVQEVDAGEGMKDCPCEICCQLTKEEDSPMIKDMLKRNREREIREYLRRMRHRQYMQCRGPYYPAPQRKCDPIVCHSCFCDDPKMQQHFGRIQAIQNVKENLQRLNCKGYKKMDKILSDLMQRLCNHLSRGGSCG